MKQFLKQETTQQMLLEQLDASEQVIINLNNKQDKIIKELQECKVKELRNDKLKHLTPKQIRRIDKWITKIGKQ